MFSSIDIIGGLGNHLFKIAALLSYVKKSPMHQIVFKYEENLPDRFNLPRKTFWNSLFKDQFKVLSPAEFDALKCVEYYEKDCHTYQELPYGYHNNILFKGYFQSFNYIDDDIREQMIHYVYSNAELMHAAYDKYNEIKEFFGNTTQDDEMISMHVRRTDYLWLGDFNFLLPLDYYHEALKLANKKKIVVFSDDIKWCKENINYNNVYFVDINNVEIEFLLMSMFQHNIIANSTFSLWASFISTYQKPKIIIAPKTWYGKGGPRNWDEIYHKYITHKI